MLDIIILYLILICLFILLIALMPMVFYMAYSFWKEVIFDKND